MSQILVRNLSPETVAALKKQAKDNKRSLEAEVRNILEHAASEAMSPEFRDFIRQIAAGRSRMEAFRDFAAQMRARSGVQTTDSAELIRQARDELDAKFR